MATVDQKSVLTISDPELAQKHGLRRGPDPLFVTQAVILFLSCAKLLPKPKTIPEFRTKLEDLVARVGRLGKQFSSLPSIIGRVPPTECQKFVLNLDLYLQTNSPSPPHTQFSSFYEAQLTNPRVGTVFTPLSLAQWVVDRTLTTKNVTTTILDPAVGTGVFPIAYLEVISRKTNQAQELVMEGVSHVYGVDLDPRAIVITQLRIWLFLLEKGIPLDSLPDLSNNFKTLNFLTGRQELLRQSFDVIIGNPPYVSLYTLPEEMRRFLGHDSYWAQFYHGKSDLSHLFTIKCISLLNNGGRLGFVLPRYWLEAEHATKMRQVLATQTQVLEIIDFRDNKLISGANVHLSLLFAHRQNTRSTNTTSVRVIQKTGEDVVDLCAVGTVGAFPTTLSPEGWPVIPLDRSEEELFNRLMSGEEYQRLGSIAFVGKGVQTGANEVFAPKHDITYLEEELLHPLFSSQELDRWLPRSLPARHLLVVTKTTPLSEESLAWSYLMGHKSRLEDRYAVKNEGTPWYAIPRFNTDLFSGEERIVCSYRDTKVQFSFLEGKGCVLTNGTAIVAHSPSLNKPLLGILNSRLIEYLLRKTARKKGRTLEFFSTTLVPLPIPKLFAFSKLTTIVRSILETIKFGKESGVTQDQLTHLESELDELVFDLYGLSKEERELVNEKVRSLTS